MSPQEDLVQNSINNIKALQSPSGLFLASAQDVSTGYNKAWLRDNFYTVMAFEATEDWDTVKTVWKAILTIFSKHEDKINWAIENKPHESWQYIHARYNPETFEEYWEEWGNKQNDAIGAILFKLAELEEKGQSVIETEDEKRITQKLIEYLNSIEYWNDPDNGIWEEYEEVHLSSVGAVVAALKKLKPLEYISIPEGMIEKGEEALKSLLPRESVSKFTDLALLSLLYPYNVVDKEVGDQILENIEYHLEKKRGVVRYKNDEYYNKNEDNHSEEAEWTMGFPWLSIIYSERGNKEKAQEYLEKTKSVLTGDRKLPELYYSNSDRPNENIPLGWAESLFVVALTKLQE
ncbi:glycoside hydrolase family 15 [Candidatus Wolfebacteria bacterium]|nr:MAG: glycoside hydrolase family 15 [Candidatus Wolfebacteria bacterium]